MATNSRNEDTMLRKTFETEIQQVKDDVLVLGSMVEQQAVHVESHVRQIQAVRAAYKEHKAKLAAAQSQ